MRLYDLTEASIFDERKLLNTKWEKPEQLMYWLRKNGFKKKGSGAFSAAFVKSGYNRIIKISNRQDDCWIRFAKWAQSVTNNPHLPDIPWVKFYDGTIFKSGHGHKQQQFFIAIIEKLAPFNPKAVNTTVDLPGLVYMYLHDEWFAHDATIAKRLEAEGLVIAQDELWGMQDIDSRDDLIQKDRRKLLKYLREVRGGRQFIMTLKAAERKGTGKCTYDMHNGNIMYRPSDKRLVLIDPLADLNSSGYYI